MSWQEAVTLQPHDALVIVDVQNDFLPGGALAVPDGDQVIAPLNEYARRFLGEGLPVVTTRDWHPINHCSFKEQGGPWPPHCVAGTPGAALASALTIPGPAWVISKGDKQDKDAYSGFEGTELDLRLRGAGAERVFVGGLATDYCVLNTVRDALRLGYRTYLLMDAIRGVEVEPGDSQRAINEMLAGGALPFERTQFA